MELYDEEWADTFDEKAQAAIPGRDGIFRIADACFADLPVDARVLIVGCGTGTELLHLASRHPGWRFEAVDPAGPMLDVCRRRLNAAGLLARVRLHQRPLDGFRTESCHAATAILVSQHLVDDALATVFFRDIAVNLTSGGSLFSVNLSAPAHNPKRESLLQIWRKQASTAGIPDRDLVNLRAKFDQDIAIRPAVVIERVLEEAGFGSPVQVFQSVIYVAWYSRKIA
jgi:tRNA (cmo5U34)-methyltransferase